MAIVKACNLFRSIHIFYGRSARFRPEPIQYKHTHTHTFRLPGIPQMAMRNSRAGPLGAGGGGSVVVLRSISFIYCSNARFRRRWPIPFRVTNYQ